MIVDALNMDCFRFSGLHETSAKPYELLVQAATLIPIWHYLCHVLHGRYLATPWLTSPHLQNFFLSFFGNPPAVTYQRELFRVSNGGTIALDWAVSSYVLPKDDTTPIVVVLPGLTSDSQSSYIRHLAFNKAKMGWNVVISNHRGLGGVPITSDLVYNCGWTNDIHEVCNRLHHKHPKAPLFLIGTSIDVSADIEYVLGADILVKYLGEDGDNAPVSGAAAISNPWDFLIGDRFIRRTLLQKFYDKLHQHCYSRLVNWDGKMRCIRHYHATCDVGKFETVDTFHRRTSSSIYVCNLCVPLLCISALDDPICTREAIPSEFPLGSTIDQDKKLVLLGKVVAAVALAKVVAKKLGFVA
ncbi:hypothetical protein PRUPE_1G030400 [Prunus persica]|uniref:Serine aminopeptidase S33 domain-containing protein n=1 Tax=Prunus persica TaxID=3760 RepID=A0A251QRX3_PRUPE|nr:hypothetical protein PRUPE_1G030400 [Prunus persica]